MSSESTDLGAPTGEAAVLVGIQSALAHRPGVRESARGLSHFGEHSLGWLAIAGAGAALAHVKGDHAARR
ncbi:MAG TPA: phosphatase PAP2 family protein, partial [Gordonia sp. (in: high G+C Gram-positive bacteria)]|nr:phosphatase PAP2 family protein [Gordonia sp. (in: high G+C Gram-positive bacteria)]